MSSVAGDGSSSIDSIVTELKHNEKAFYGTTPNLASHTEFFETGGSGDITIVKGTAGNIVEFLISGIFEIDHHNFYMGAEGSYFPSSTFNCSIAATKLTCQLIPVAKDPTYQVSCDDFGVIAANINALEHVIGHKKGISTMSAVREPDGVTSIRLSHALFAVSNVFIWTLQC